MTPQTLLAFDFGLRRIGIAVGQTRSRTATELETVRARDGKPAWDRIDRLVREWEPDALVLGKPGAPHQPGTRLQRFGAELVQRYNLPLLWVDESLTTEAANAELTGEQSNLRRKRDMRDQVAARLILETHFSSPGDGQESNG